MNIPSSFRRACTGAALLALMPLCLAQTPPAKQPPRLPPNPSEAAKIPAGVDTGSPTTSPSVPLGTPVPPDATVDRVDQRTRSAAARLAARPDPLSRTGAPLAPAQPLAGEAVIREASRPGALPVSGTSESRPSCRSNDDPSFRSSMSQCTGLVDRAARSACVDRLMDARRGCV